MDKEKIEKLLKRYVKPHQKISREVEEADLERVIEEAVIMHDLCYIPIGKTNGGCAVAHQQIDDKDPLRFFVIRDSGKIIINPKIVNHTKSLVDSKEGCLSFSEEYPIIVQRWNKIEVEYQTLGPGEEEDSVVLVDVKEGVSGRDAKIYQHELDHFDCKYIYI
jgi:peptide deformylase